MRNAFVSILWIGLAACTVGEGTPPPGPSGPAGADAAITPGADSGNGNPEQADASGSGAQPAACQGSAYDPCTDNTQCSSANCKTFGGAGLEVCTVTCTPGDNTTCPTQNGQPAQCNNMGICKPAAANSCTR